MGRRLHFQRAENPTKKCPVASEVTHAHAHADLNDSRVARSAQANGVPVRIVKAPTTSNIRLRHKQLSVSAPRI
jgi:hypothetical protein